MDMTDLTDIMLCQIIRTRKPQHEHPTRRRTQPIVLNLDLKLLPFVIVVIMITCPIWCADDDITTPSTTEVRKKPTWADYQHVKANITIYLNKTCDFAMYRHFFELVEQGTSRPRDAYSQYIGQIWTQHPTQKGSGINVHNVMVPESLCIETDEYKYLDMNKYDCLPNKLDVLQVAGHCECGSRWSQIDLNDNRSYRGVSYMHFSHEYFAYTGLKKLLVMEGEYFNETANKLKCVASRFGHCTLEEYWGRPNWNITKCAQGFKCRNVTVWNPITALPLYNSYTEEWWGVCISESTKDSIDNQLYSGGISGIINRMPIVLLVCLAVNITFGIGRIIINQRSR